MQPLVDSHCHMDFAVFNTDRSLIIEACKKLDFKAIIVPGVGRNEWENLLSICRNNDLLVPALGLHPCFINEHHRDDLEHLEQLCATESLIALGEIGLDFFILKNKHAEQNNAEQNNARQRQEEYFFQQLQIALQYQLPVLIHARKSHEQVIQQLKNNRASGGIIHAFSGSYEQAKEYLKIGFKLGFGGAFSYPKATKLRSLITRLPLDAWVLETDAPDMSPQKYHGQRNSPQYLPEIAQTYIDLCAFKLDSEMILEQLYRNTLEVLPKLQSMISRNQRIEK